MAALFGVQERLVSVVYGLLMQSKLHFLAALREGILTHLKSFVKEVSNPPTHTHIIHSLCVSADCQDLSPDSRGGRNGFSKVQPGNIL